MAPAPQTHAQQAQQGQQAGGGAGDTQRTVKTVDKHVKTHLRRIFDSHAGPDQKWTPEETKNFLKGQGHDQGDGAGLDWDGFVGYMTSSKSTITKDPQPTDLSWPLSSYFISSSHNTYLSGNQLSSASTTEAYTDVLRRGCRCVEVDVWDGDDSDSESSSDDEATVQRKQKQKKQQQEQRQEQQQQQQKKKNRLSRISTFKDKLPDSLTSRLDKTSLGKKIEEREAKKEGGASAASTGQEKVGNGIEKSRDKVEDVEAGDPEVALVEPRVLHGYTLTKEITFRDVCVAIGKSAFAASDLPLIVSLEVHCGPAQQAIMVQIMKEAWAQYLVSEPEDKTPRLPSPAELKNKILVKVKYAPPGSSPDETDSTDDDRPPPTNAEAGKKPEGKKKGSKIIQDLSRMGIYTRGVSFKSFDQPEASMPTHIFSLSEKKFLDHHEKQNAKLWEHNKNFLMRAYPAGTRITSSNLNPAPFWGCGTQVVALNWQQTDEGTMLNEGLFAGTGGYVLKPEGTIHYAIWEILKLPAFFFIFLFSFSVHYRG